MLYMLFQFVAFPNKHYRQSYEASNMKGWDLKKWVRASLSQCGMTRRKFQVSTAGLCLLLLNFFFIFFLSLRIRTYLKGKVGKISKRGKTTLKLRWLQLCGVYTSFWLFLEHKPFFLKLKLAVLYRDEYLRFF